jgi:hypothetical protein
MSRIYSVASADDDKPAHDEEEDDEEGDDEQGDDRGDGYSE